jgi:uncharacterized membrane protein YgcG
MSDDDALRGEMRRLGHHLGRDPLDLDEGTAERLLAGTLDPADAPPAYAAVAHVLAAAAAPPRPEELAGEAEALDRFRSSSPMPPVPAGRRLARLAVVSAVLVGLLSVGGVGFATGVLPRTGQWLNHTIQSVVGTAPASTAPSRPGPGSSTSTLLGGPAAPSTTPGSVQGPSSSAVPGSTAAAEALCKAWKAGKGKHMDPAALQALAAAAGGSENIPAYCHAVQEGQGGSGQGGGNGNGQGGGSGNGQGGGGGGQSTPGAANQSTPGATGPATAGSAGQRAPGAGR